MVLEARAVSRATVIVTSRGAPNDGNCRLTLPVIKGRCARGALPHTFIIGAFKSLKENSVRMKHIYNDSGVLLTARIARIIQNPRQ